MGPQLLFPKARATAGVLFRVTERGNLDDSHRQLVSKVLAKIGPPIADHGGEQGLVVPRRVAHVRLALIPDHATEGIGRQRGDHAVIEQRIAGVEIFHLRIVLQRLAAAPAFDPGSPHAGHDQSDGPVELLMDLAAEVVAYGREFPYRLRTTTRPGPFAIALRRLGRDTLHKELADLRDSRPAGLPCLERSDCRSACPCSTAPSRARPRPKAHS